MTAPQTAEELAAAQELEYGTYRAVTPIFIGGTRAFNPGDPVPVSHIEPDDQFGLLAEGQVEKVAPDDRQKPAPAQRTAPTPSSPAASTTEV